jgi:hypothetical protein
MHRPYISLVAAIAFLVPAIDTLADEATGAAYSVLNDDASELRDAFNQAQGTVRLIFVVDPICPGCLRNLDDIDKALLSKTDDPRLRTFVVHVPVLGPKEKDVGPAAKLVQNEHARQYWNPSGAFGRALTEAADLKDSDGKPVYAWDVWAIYGPDATWEGKLPPKPLRLMHNLWALDGSTEFPHFDAEVFAQEARALLTELPPTATQP